jgi:hypothetical protein
VTLDNILGLEVTSGTEALHARVFSFLKYFAEIKSVLDKLTRTHSDING